MGVQRRQGVPGGRGVDDVAAQGGPVANLHPGELPGGGCQGRAMLLHQRMVLQLSQGGQGPDGNYPFPIVDAGQFRQPLQVHQVERQRPVVVEGRHQVGAPRQPHHLISRQVRQQLEILGQAGGTVIIQAPPAAACSTASTIL